MPQSVRPSLCPSVTFRCSDHIGRNTYVNNYLTLDRDQHKSRAVAWKPHDAVVKFDTYISKFAAASRDSPGDSTAFFLNTARGPQEFGVPFISRLKFRPPIYGYPNS